MSDRDTCEQCGGAIVLDARECVNGHPLCRNPGAGWNAPCECAACMALFAAEESQEAAIHGLIVAAEDAVELLSRILGSKARDAAAKLRASLDEMRRNGMADYSRR